MEDWVAEVVEERVSMEMQVKHMQVQMVFPMMQDLFQRVLAGPILVEVVRVQMEIVVINLDKMVQQE
jgi:hypothetical protein